MSKKEPHPSHEMTEWRGAIVTLISTSRFGSIRECKNCGAEHAKTAAGEAMHDELKVACPNAPKPTPEANIGSGI